VRCDGLKITELLPAILQLFPLDRFVKSPVKLMSVAPGDAYATPIWDEYTAIIRKYETQQADIDFLERFEFYKAAGSAYVVVATGEKQLYANIILKKGVIEG
jgi:L-fucose mutarotase